MSASAGVQAAIETYRREALVPSGVRSLSPAVESDWDTYEARLWRYHHYDLYYFNTVFSQLDRYARQHLKDDDLYRYTRGIFNPVWRLVNITAAKCYGGNLDWQTLRTGAVPLEGLDDNLTAAISRAADGVVRVNQQIAAAEARIIAAAREAAQQVQAQNGGDGQKAPSADEGAETEKKSAEAQREKAKEA